jgi:hypothetical protein
VIVPAGDVLRVLVATAGAAGFSQLHRRQQPRLHRQPAARRDRRQPRQRRQHLRRGHAHRESKRRRDHLYGGLSGHRGFLHGDGRRHQLDGNTVTFDITDGGLGDDDLVPNGTIDDPGGPGAGAAVPAMPLWALAVLALLLLAAARLVMRTRAAHG